MPNPEEVKRLPLCSRLCLLLEVPGGRHTRRRARLSPQQAGLWGEGNTKKPPWPSPKPGRWWTGQGDIEGLRGIKVASEICSLPSFARGLLCVRGCPCPTLPSGQDNSLTGPHLNTNSLQIIEHRVQHGALCCLQDPLLPKYHSPASSPHLPPPQPQPEPTDVPQQSPVRGTPGLG